MKLKNYLLSLFIIALSIPAFAASDKHQGPAWQSTEKNFSINQIRDLALIYQGGSQRIPWTEDQIEPYVVHKFANGKKNWLFDGFLFLEFANAMPAKMTGNAISTVCSRKTRRSTPSTLV